MKTKNFIENIILNGISKGENEGKVITRFPPEPNGYLHIGHAKSVCLNFNLAEKYGNNKCNLRFDDTNPEKEEEKFSAAILEDIHWLGYKPSTVYYASDYFEKLYQYAIDLIKSDKAYVCDLSADDIRKQRGTLTTCGENSPYRSRSIEENLQRFTKMRNGEFKEGACSLRAKIDMASNNINLRDPVIYRIRKITHPRTGNDWPIYPTYDFAHCVSDSLEGITHSVCTLEFEDHRPLYDWLLDQLNIHHPQQIEFARLELTYTITSKRKIKELISKGIVEAWDDPRLLTLSAMRRRGIPASAIRDFCEQIGVTKKNSEIDIEALETSIRDTLNIEAPRAMAVLDPLKVIIINYPENKVEELEAKNNPNNPETGKRKVPFSREIYIEKEDFMENPPAKYFRLSPHNEVRLKYAYYIKCEEIIRNDKGEIIELHCRYDPQSQGGKTADGRKVKGTIHWVSALHAVTAKVCLYDRLFNTPHPNMDELETSLNLDSKIVIENALLEPSLKHMQTDQTYQFERLGYFIRDDKTSTANKLIINRTITLYDSWNKIKQKK